MNTINFVTDINTKDTVKTVTVTTIVRNNDNFIIVTNNRTIVNDRKCERLYDEGWYN